MYAIKAVGYDIWAPKKDTTAFIFDDACLSHQFKMNNLPFSYYIELGVPAEYRRVYQTTAQIRRSLASISKETVFYTDGFFSGLKRGVNPATFSNYEVVNLLTGQIHSLTDVFDKKI